MHTQFTDKETLLSFLTGLHLATTDKNLVIDIETMNVVGRVHEMVKGKYEVIMNMEVL